MSTMADEGGNESSDEEDSEETGKLDKIIDVTLELLDLL